MEIKKIYKIFCKIVGASSTIVLTWGILLNQIFGVSFHLYEPRIYIAIPEIIIGLLVTPYLIKLVFLE